MMSGAKYLVAELQQFVLECEILLLRSWIDVDIWPTEPRPHGRRARTC